VVEAEVGMKMMRGFEKVQKRTGERSVEGPFERV
jgi:hypothetical protein